MVRGANKQGKHIQKPFWETNALDWRYRDKKRSVLIENYQKISVSSKNILKHKKL